ncbi:putative bifunctional diguanylate cyclase/phosphodiesterase [Stieleria varia]|uniref:Cyclic di-GMP phosphodiesterase Gmr n=1 Tax=Stieleria varia TaxID=2528005 RepID=A0A5C6AGE6_9BACT|nr:bifunctional diguanylate cyclase/phosphodiesterase [Stieleria varia]TWT98530.1 Cyclic di-GMP phosphodiesterase Gmr [Stieleria varia]
MIDWGKPSECNAVFVESTNADELRAQRVWRFVIVLWFTWIFFAVFLTFRGYTDAARVCLVNSVLLFVINWTYRKDKDFRTVMNLNLAVSGFGLLGVSVSNPAMYGTMLFYPISILVASQLLGVRAAMSWFIVNVLGITAFFMFVYGVNQSIYTSKLDEFVLFIGVAACVYFCCQQGEEYYRKRTMSLIQLSEDLKAKSDTLQVLATTDALTGLTNRFQFQELLQNAVDDAMATSSQMALYLIDMDGFKEINDTMGHPVGDDALVEIAKRLTLEFGDRYGVARLGGDEFCIITPCIEGPKEADAIARHLCAVLTDRYVLGDVEFPLGASVGYALCPSDATNTKDLLAFADTAMFHAKENQMGFACYQREMTEKLIEYRAVQEKLSLALEHDEFFLVYQPQVNIQSGEVIGVEALLRWRSDGEIVPPTRFIHLLERSREILPVSNWIIRQSCRQLAEWNAQGYLVEVSVNVSVLQFNDPHFITCIKNSVNEFGIDPRQLDFEITEGLLIENVDEAVAKLHEIKALGSSISIDDFGTGYSSLSYLRLFPVDRLKIDRAFVKDIPTADDGVIASSIIVLAKSLGLKVLAEGAETQEQLDFLARHDCDEYQGYFFSRPIAPDEVSAFFTKASPQAVNHQRND